MQASQRATFERLTFMYRRLDEIEKLIPRRPQRTLHEPLVQSGRRGLLLLGAVLSAGLALWIGPIMWLLPVLLVVLAIGWPPINAA